MISMAQSVWFFVCSRAFIKWFVMFISHVFQLFCCCLRSFFAIKVHRFIIIYYALLFSTNCHQFVLFFLNWKLPVAIQSRPNSIYSVSVHRRQKSVVNNNNWINGNSSFVVALLKIKMSCRKLHCVCFSSTHLRTWVQDQVIHRSDYSARSERFKQENKSHLMRTLTTRYTFFLKFGNVGKLQLK